MASRQAARIDVVAFKDGKVIINLRLRGETQWLYYEGIAMSPGDRIVVLDGGDGENEKPEFSEFEALPRSETMDEAVDKYG